MFAGLVIYVAGGKYLPAETPKRSLSSTGDKEERGQHGELWLLLLGVGISVTIFRGAYEQIGNTISLWTDSGVDRALAGFVIPMTWFQSLNPLLVITMTPLLLLHWRRQADAGRDTPPARKMAIGALFVAAAYLVLAAVSSHVGAGRASWPWLLLFFVILTFGELYILPTGLGLFARLAPPHFGATTVAAWFLTIFSGGLFAGFVGAAWSRASHPLFFILLAALATLAAMLLWLLDRPIRRFEARAILNPMVRVPMSAPNNIG